MILFLSSFLLVGFGQPAWIGWLAPLAAVCGYALFWRAYRGKFWAGTLWFTAVQLVQLSWMTAIEYHGLYILFVYAGLAFWLGLQFGALTRFLKGELTLLRLLAAASLWTLMEWARMHILCGFSFNPVGLALTFLTPSLQLASLFGVLGLSFWVILTNGALLARSYLLACGLAAFPFLYGAVQFAVLGETEGKALTCALVQTGLLPAEKTLLEGRGALYISPYEQWQRIIRLLKEKKGRWDLLVLPESALPFPAEIAAYNAQIARRLLEFHGIPSSKKSVTHFSNIEWAESIAHYFGTDLVIGLDGGGDKEGERYAAAYHFSKEGGVARYEKRVLVPLAEYLPFSFLRSLVASYGINDFFTPGREAKVLQAGVPFSPSICYEETFPDLMREGRLKGAELFVNMTNDNWYPHSRLPQQHFALARLRAVENGIPLVRACNSGVTAVVDRFGRTVAALGEESGVLVAQLPVATHPTPFMFWGNAGIVGIALLIVFFFLREVPSKGVRAVPSSERD